MAAFQFAEAVADIAEVFFFEQWLRHYYVVEMGDELVLDIPEDDMKLIYEKHQHLGSLADMLNKQQVSYESCQASVCSFLGVRFDGSKYGPNVVSSTLDSKAFKIELYVFNVWLKGHESYLDAEKLSFGDWMEMYKGWNGMDEVKEYRRKLEAGGGDPNEPASKAVH